MKCPREYSNNPSPLASVIIPTYNRPEGLKEAIQSVLRQEYTCFEIIVINDGGVDVQEIIATYKVGWDITYIQHGNNRGLAAARNTGIREARGKYIAYLDDDDIFYPNHLRTLVEYLETTGYKVAYSEAYRAFQRKQDDTYVTTYLDKPYSDDLHEDQILIRNLLPVLCVVHDKSCLGEVGFFDESLSSHEDWDLWIRMSRKFKFAHIKQLTCEFRRRDDGTNMTEEKKKDFLRTMKIIYEKYSQYTKDKMFILKEQKRNLLNLWGDIYLSRASEPEKEQSHISEAIREKAKQDYKKLQGEFRKMTKKESMLMVKEFLDHYPCYAPAHKELGIIYFQQGEKWGSLTHITQALSINPDDGEAKEIFVRLCSGLGFFDQALKGFHNILVTNSGHLGSLLAQGKLLFFIGHKKEALRIFIKVIAEELKII
jgi:glycosyltransferase involved in cell wall biosynthesis